MRKNKTERLLSVIVPAYKEAKTIRKRLQELSGALSEYKYNYEIICVIDGFVDDSVKEAKKVKDKHLTVYGYKQNVGKGHAVRYGMVRAKGDLIAFMDSGMEIPPKSLIMGLEHFDWYGADIVIGSKRHPVSRVNYPFSRRVFSLVYQLLGRILFGLNVRDTQVGVKIFKKEVLEKILPRMLVKRYAFDIEMLAVAKYFGYGKIYESPVEIHYHFDDLTHASTLRDIFRMFWDTLAVFYRLRILHYYNDKNKNNWIN